MAMGKGTKKREEKDDLTRVTVIKFISCSSVKSLHAQSLKRIDIQIAIGIEVSREHRQHL